MILCELLYESKFNLTHINLTGYFEQTQFPDTDMPVEFKDFQTPVFKKEKKISLGK